MMSEPRMRRKAPCLERLLQAVDQAAEGKKACAFQVAMERPVGIHIRELPPANSGTEGSTNKE
eukprot:9287773-Lingulodinium_polyedra.AAC.1